MYARRQCRLALRAVVKLVPLPTPLPSPAPSPTPLPSPCFFRLPRRRQACAPNADKALATHLDYHPVPTLLYMPYLVSI